MCPSYVVLCMKSVLFLYCCVYKMSLLCIALYAKCPCYVLLYMPSVLIHFAYKVIQNKDTLHIKHYIIRTLCNTVGGARTYYCEPGRCGCGAHVFDKLTQQFLLLTLLLLLRLRLRRTLRLCKQHAYSREDPLHSRTF